MSPLRQSGSAARVTGIVLLAALGILLYLLLRNEAQRQKVTARVIPLTTPEIAEEIIAGMRLSFPAKGGACPSGFTFMDTGNGTDFICVSDVIPSA